MLYVILLPTLSTGSELFKSLNNYFTGKLNWFFCVSVYMDTSQQAWHRSQAQKHGAWKHLHSTPFSIYDLSIQKRGSQVWQGCPKDSMQLAQTGIWILVSLGKYLRTHLKDHTRYDWCPEIHGKPRRVSFPVGKAQLAGCLRVQVGGLLEWDAGIQ